MRVTKQKTKAAEEKVFLRASVLMVSGDKIKQIAHSRGYKQIRPTLIRPTLETVLMTANNMRILHGVYTI